MEELKVYSGSLTHCGGLKTMTLNVENKLLVLFLFLLNTECFICDIRENVIWTTWETQHNSAAA
jgi:hypothetical protein